MRASRGEWRTHEAWANAVKAIVSVPDECEGGFDPGLDLLAGLVCEGVATVRNGRIVWASRRLAELAGRASAGELRGVALDDLLDDEGQGLPTCGRGAKARSGSCRFRGLEGATRCVELRCQWLADDQVELWTFRDATDEKRNFQEVSDLSRELLGRNRERADLVARLGREQAERADLLTIVSHELRTPLTVIAGYTRLLLDEAAGPLNPKQRTYLDEARRSCGRLDEFVSRLLHATHGEFGSESVVLRDASLAGALSSVASFLRPLFAEHDLEVRESLDPESLYACFDRDQIEQVLTNILGNAIKYSRPGGCIEVATAPLRMGGVDVIEVTIADDGPGIPEADRQRVFEPYVRASEAGRANGLGLGLAICRRIVESHQGAIWVDERPGGGCRFHFTLPAASCAEEHSPAGL